MQCPSAANPSEEAICCPAAGCTSAAAQQDTAKQSGSSARLPGQAPAVLVRGAAAPGVGLQLLCNANAERGGIFILSKGVCSSQPQAHTAPGHSDSQYPRGHYWNLSGAALLTPLPQVVVAGTACTTWQWQRAEPELL